MRVFLFCLHMYLVLLRLHTHFIVYGCSSICLHECFFKKGITCLHKFKERGIHCTASSCFICLCSFLLLSHVRFAKTHHKWSRFFESCHDLSSRLNSPCQVVRTRLHFHPLPFSHAVCPFTIRLPIRIASWISPHDFCQDDLSIHGNDLINSIWVYLTWMVIVSYIETRKCGDFYE